MTIYKLFGNKGKGGKDDEPPVNGQKQGNPKIESVLFTADEPFEDRFTTKREARSIQSGIMIRWVLLLFSVIAFFVFLIQAISAVLSLLLNFVTLYKNSLCREVLKRYWRGMCRWMVFSVGSLIGVFSPSLGLGFVVLYFAIRSEQGKDDFVSQFFVRQYQGMGRF